MNLHLPPGWRLLYASGVDQARGGMALIVEFARLFRVPHHGFGGGTPMGQEMGVIALLCLVLSYQELDAPRSLWIVCVLR